MGRPIGGIHTDLSCGGAIESSNHFENNTAADIDIGSVSVGAEGLTIEGNYHGGNFGVTSYVPIKIHRSTGGVTIRRNFLQTGNRIARDGHRNKLDRIDPPPAITQQRIVHNTAVIVRVACIARIDGAYGIPRISV